MGLKTVLDLVEARTAQVVGQAGAKIPNFGFGEKAKYLTEAPPRVTWVPLHGRVTSADQRAASDKVTPRQLWTRHPQMEARIWGEDYEQVEALIGHIVAAFTYVNHGSYSVLSEQWDTSGQMQKGVLGVFLIEVRLPLTDEPSKTVGGSGTPITTPVTGQIASA